jgi:general stress protein YciG
MSDETSKAAAAMGRKGGAATSQAKKDAARANGKKGGRPKKQVSGKPVKQGKTRSSQKPI